MSCVPGVRDSSICWVEGGLPQFGKREFGVYGSEFARKCELLAFVTTFSGMVYCMVMVNKQQLCF